MLIKCKSEGIGPMLRKKDMWLTSRDSFNATGYL